MNKFVLGTPVFANDPVWLITNAADCIEMAWAVKKWKPKKLEIIFNMDGTTFLPHESVKEILAKIGDTVPVQLYCMDTYSSNEPKEETGNGRREILEYLKAPWYEFALEVQRKFHCDLIHFL